MTRLLQFIRHRWRTLTLMILAAITVLSLWPLERLPEMSGSDKIHHYIAYVGLMLPTALRLPRRWLLLALLFLLWSGAIELIQPWVNRYGEWADLAANGAGLLTGLLLGRLLGRLFPGADQSGSRQR
jgi:hypothetical protein